MNASVKSGLPRFSHRFLLGLYLLEFVGASAVAGLGLTLPRQPVLTTGMVVAAGTGAATLGWLIAVFPPDSGWAWRPTCSCWLPPSGRGCNG
ncbi:MAG: hypothetical protein JOY92_11825 [Verrucomicrobia bacterium]|nr:hypothetical protein [Verrucomicrobiota bacterium]